MHGIVLDMVEIYLGLNTVNTENRYLRVKTEKDLTGRVQGTSLSTVWPVATFLKILNSESERHPESSDYSGSSGHPAERDRRRPTPRMAAYVRDPGSAATVTPADSLVSPLVTSPDAAADDRWSTDQNRAPLRPAIDAVAGG